MGISKKKLKKQTKINEQELMDEIERQHDENAKANRAKLLAKKLKDGQLFSDNTGKSIGDLKGKRQKLKKDRFKEISNARTSKTEKVLMKRLATKATRREQDNIVKKQIKPSNR